jgi:hypothetical protein
MIHGAQLNLKPISFRSKSNRKADEFNLTESLQKLGLDDDANEEQNLANIQGSYLSYMLLRHLRLRDLKIQVSLARCLIFILF